MEALRTAIAIAKHERHKAYQNKAMKGAYLKGYVEALDIVIFQMETMALHYESQCI